MTLFSYTNYRFGGNMSLKIEKIISTISIILLSFLFHNMYKWFPNSLFAIFFPVNESIFEHMKILFSSICFYSIIEYIILIKNTIKFNNFLFSTFFTSILSIFMYLIIFLPVYNIMGENLIFSISLMIIVIIINQIISYNILNMKHIKYVNYISIILIIVSYIIFGYFTYHPLHNYLFIDHSTNTYGINQYNI